VGEVLVISLGFTLWGLVLLAEVGPTGFFAGQGVPEHQLG
jgi:hypothetical protein